jgi:hypothetical protein
MNKHIPTKEYTTRNEYSKECIFFSLRYSNEKRRHVKIAKSITILIHLINTSVVKVSLIVEMYKYGLFIKISKHNIRLKTKK